MVRGAWAAGRQREWEGGKAWAEYVREGVPPVFFGCVHSKDIKVFCFQEITEVFILRGLTGSICTKIVQVLEVLRTKGLGACGGKRTGKSAFAT